MLIKSVYVKIRIHISDIVCIGDINMIIAAGTGGDYDYLPPRRLPPIRQPHPTAR